MREDTQQCSNAHLTGARKREQYLLYNLHVFFFFDAYVMLLQYKIAVLTRV